MIYDAVIHPDGDHVIMDSEHHVTQQEEGHVDPTDGSAGPRGSWNFPQGTKMSPNQWAPLPAVPTLLAQASKNNRWVELHDCTGAAGEI